MAEIRKLFPYVRPYLPLLFAALVLVTLSGALEASIVMLLEPIFNSLSRAASIPDPSAVIRPPTFEFLQKWLGLKGGSVLPRVAVFLILFSLLKGVFLYCAEYLMAYSGQNVVARLRKSVYSHLLDQSMAFFANRPTGHLMARIISDTERLQETVSRTMTESARQVVLLLAFLGLVFYIDWKLSLLAFLIAPVVLFLTLQLGKRVRRISWASQEKISDLSSALQETITGQRIVKAFGMEDYERSRFESLVDRLVGLNLKLTRTSAISSPLMEFLGYLLFAPFLLYASQQIGGGVSAGAFVAFVVALFKLYEPVRKLSRMHLHFEQAFACAGRVFELLEADIEIKESVSARTLAPLRDTVDFREVSFQYGQAQATPILEKIDLTIQKGEVVALVGRSGAGKTTLASLLPRFYDVTSGQIAFDGNDIRDVTLQSLRKQIAIVTQETLLFNDTVRSNIAYGRLDASREEIVEAAKAAFIHDFIVSLPNGYQTLIGERGERLSGGQRQRIAVARAILKKAPVLILDEATSALDSASEELVQRALQNLMLHCTTLVIAHRLSTIIRADRIVVMQDGRIMDVGDHSSLVSRSGLYRQLYEMQSGGLKAVREQGSRASLDASESNPK